MKEINRAKKRNSSFTTGSIPKSIILFAGPFMLGIFVQNLYGAVDLFVVGNFATTVDVVAVTIGSQLMSLVTQLIIGFATGITILVGRYAGAKDGKRLTKTVGSSIFLFAIVAVFLTAIYLLFYQSAISALQTPSEAVAATRQYLVACAIGIVFIVGYNVISGILSGMGDSKTPFLFILVACIINIVLDIILVKYLHMGALGAAVATTIAQAGSFTFSLIYLRLKGIGIALKKTDIRFHKEEIKNVISIGAPVAIQNVLVGVSFLFITAIINQMGIIASASVGIVEKLITFLFVPATALGTAVGTASAQNIGAHKRKRAKQCMWYGMLMALIPSILITIFCQFRGEMLTGILTTNPEVVALSATYLQSYIIDCIMVSLVFCMNGYFNSLNKSWFSLVHSLISTFIIRVPLSYFLSRLANTSLYLIGWSSPISTFVSILLCLMFLIKMDRKEKRDDKSLKQLNTKKPIKEAPY